MKVIDAIRHKVREWVVGNLSVVDPRFYAALADDQSYSGQQVGVNSALQLAAVWSCVRLISETIGTLPLPVYRTDAKGRKIPAKDLAVYYLLHDAPNDDMTACEFWEAMVACMCLWGNAYALKKTGPSGTLQHLDPLRPDWMEPRKNTRYGPIVYRYHDPDAKLGYIDYDESLIFHLKGFGTDGIRGLSPISYARHSLGNAIAVEKSVGHTFTNMVRPSGVLSTDQPLKQGVLDQYGDKLADKFAGTINAGKPMVLPFGFKFMPVAMPPEDAQMLETRAFHVEEICRWFRVPPFMIGHTTKVTSWGSGIEQQNIGFLTYALRPYLTRIEQTIRKSLISPYLKDISAEFNLEGLMRADSQGRAALYATMTQNGLLTRNEIRALENRPPLPGGDDLTVQVNLIPISLLGKAAQASISQAAQPQQQPAQETAP